MTKSLEYKIALLVDGPNMFTAGFKDIRETVKKYGELTLAEIYLTKDVPVGLYDQVMCNGYKPVIESFKDVDTALTSRLTEIACSPRYKHVNLIALAAMDGDYIPAVHKAKEYGKKVLMVGLSTDGNSTALKTLADYFETVDERSHERKTIGCSSDK